MFAYKVGITLRGSRKETQVTNKTALSDSEIAAIALARIGVHFRYLAKISYIEQVDPSDLPAPIPTVVESNKESSRPLPQQGESIRQRQSLNIFRK